jgi:hypothetical protein
MSAFLRRRVMSAFLRLWLEWFLVLSLRFGAIKLGWSVPGLWTYTLVVVMLHFVAYVLTTPPPKEPA